MAELHDGGKSLQQLGRDQIELQFAFRELGAFLGAALTGRAMLDPEYVAASLDQLALEAGDKLAENCGEAATPNPHLTSIADQVRKLCTVIVRLQLDRLRKPDARGDAVQAPS